MNEHKFRLYWANKRINPLALQPVLILSAGKESGRIICEYFILTGVEQIGMVHRSTEYGVGKEVAQNFFDDVMTLDLVFESQLNFATARFEKSIYDLDLDLHRKIFLEDRNFAFEVTNEHAFRVLALDRSRNSEIIEFFKLARDPSLKPLRELWNMLSRIDIKVD